MDIKNVAKNINRPVTYKRIGYTLTACTLRKEKDKFYYTAELKDKTGNSVLIVPLDRVEEA